MRRLCFNVAMSLDGYIAGPGGEYDWIIMDPKIDFKALFDRFDCLLMGRRTYEASASQTSSGRMFGKRVVVVSETLSPADHPKLEIIGSDAAAKVKTLKAKKGKDIWLFGGGKLFATMLAAGLVDSVEVAVIPVLLGAGIPLLAPPGPLVKLTLKTSNSLPTGIVLLTYAPKY